MKCENYHYFKMNIGSFSVKNNLPVKSSVQLSSFILIFCINFFCCFRSIRPRFCNCVGWIKLGSYRCCIIAIFFLLTRLFPIIFHHRASVSPSEAPNNIITLALLIRASHCICLVSFITRLDCSFIIKSLISSLFLNFSFLI